MSKHGSMRIEGVAEDSIDVEVDYAYELDAYDVAQFIKSHATDTDMKIIHKSLALKDVRYINTVTLFDVYKNNLLVEAMKKYSLQELEEILKT